MSFPFTKRAFHKFPRKCSELRLWTLTIFISYKDLFYMAKHFEPTVLIQFMPGLELVKNFGLFVLLKILPVGPSCYHQNQLVFTCSTEKQVLPGGPLQQSTSTRPNEINCSFILYVESKKTQCMNVQASKHMSNRLSIPNFSAISVSIFQFSFWPRKI
jgi:hypothetical protein